MMIILQGIDQKEKITLTNISETTEIIDIKYKLSKEAKIKIDTIQLYYLNQTPLNDMHNLRHYSITDNTVLIYKLDKTLLQIMIEIYLKQIEKITLNISYSSSVYLVKRMIEEKTQIKLKEQILYLNKTILPNESSFCEIMNNSQSGVDKKTERSKSFDRTSVSTEMSTPRYLLLKLLIQKSNHNFCLGLNFSFNYMKNLKKINWDNSAPSFREIEDGISLICYCQSKQCSLYNQMFVYNLGNI